MHHFPTEQLAPVTFAGAWVCYEMAVIIPLCACLDLRAVGRFGGQKQRRRVAKFAAATGDIGETAGNYWARVRSGN